MTEVVFEYGGEFYLLGIPDSVYVPNVWTQLLLDSLLQQLISLDSPSLIVEVGIGSGIVPIVLINQLGTGKLQEYIGLDINSVACETAKLNLHMNSEAPGLCLLLQSDLLGNLPARSRGKVDVVVANLPQVPDPGRSEINVNDYYAPKSRREALLHRFDQRGIGLLCDFLLTTRAALSDDGVVILTLAGRCGFAEIEELFAYCHMSFRIASKSIIQQDSSTIIVSFAEVERMSDFVFTFYADEIGRCQVSAEDAMRRVSQGKLVYHDLYVIMARPGSS